MIAAAGRMWAAMERRPGRALVIAICVAALLRLPFAGWPLGADEGGFLLVAKQWDGDGPLLYDGQWVDRPPILIAVFKIGTVLGGPVGLRLLALSFAALTIGGAWWAGRIINGARGAVVAALVAAALSSNFLLNGFELVGEGVAGAFVMLSCACTLAASYGRGSYGKRPRGGAETIARTEQVPRPALALATCAGFLAAVAVLTKQNFLDAAVFAAVLLVARAQKSWRLGAGWLGGACVPVIGVLAWTLGTGPGLGQFVHAMVGFRRQAAATIANHLAARQVERMHWMAVLFVVSGMAWLVWALLARIVRDDSDRRLSLALLAMLGYGVFSIVAGMSWWRHYLLELVPVLAMSAALASTRSVSRMRWVRSVQLATVGVLASALVATGIGAFGSSDARLGAQHDAALSSWLRDASQPGDTIVLAFGSPNVAEMAGLSTPYRYSWSLPVRLMDPNLITLVGLLDSPHAPTWLVRVTSFNMYGLDNPQFTAARSAHYRLVGTICGHPVYLHRGLARQLPDAPNCNRPIPP